MIIRKAAPVPGAAFSMDFERGEPMATITTIQGAWGDEKLMDLLIQANPAHNATAVFSAGVTLAVPESERRARSAPPPWRKE